MVWLETQEITPMINSNDVVAGIENEEEWFFDKKDVTLLCETSNLGLIFSIMIEAKSNITRVICLILNDEVDNMTGEWLCHCSNEQVVAAMMSVQFEIFDEDWAQLVNGSD